MGSLFFLQTDAAARMALGYPALSANSEYEIVSPYPTFMISVNIAFSKADPEIIMGIEKFFLVPLKYSLICSIVLEILTDIFLLFVFVDLNYILVMKLFDSYMSIYAIFRSYMFVFIF